MRRGGLAYVDERPYDRDSNGILWRRMPSTPGKGKPQYAAVRVRRFSLSGVHGVLHRPSYPVPVPYDVGSADFGDHRMPWRQAAQLMMLLAEFTLVGLAAEYRANAEGR
jgi:hypothetical protein